MKEKKKILVIQETDWILRGPHQHHHLFGRLNRNKYDIRVVDFPLIWDKENNKKYPRFRGFHSLEKECKVDPSKSIRILRSPFINLPILRILSILFQRKVIKKQIKEFQPDLAICFASLLNVNYVNKLCKRYKIPFIYYLLEKYYTLVPRKFLEKFSKILEFKAMRNSDKNIVLNNVFKDYVDKVCGDGKETEIIPGGIDLNRYKLDIEAHYLKHKYGITEEDKVLFFMGWIYEFSGMKEVVQEIAKSIDKHLKLMIIGKGGLYDELQRIVKNNKIEDRVILTGWVSYDEIPQYISIANICLLPAYKNEVMRDIVPIKMYEYLAMGKPVIATRLPGIKKEFGENNGVLYIENPEDTIKCAKDLLENSIDEGMKGRKFAEKYNWIEITKKFEDVMEEIFKK
ncbi:MAG: glycosyltransferase [Promethearchaeota archaeon]